MAKGRDGAAIELSVHLPDDRWSARCHYGVAKLALSRQKAGAYELRLV